MISARFDGGEAERKMRRVHKILTERNYEVLMVGVGPGENFAKPTMKYLLRIKKEQGIILAVCTKHYAEVTASQYSSHEELRYASDYGIEVLPLQMEDVYPPKPAWGETHPYDKDGDGQALVALKLQPSLLYLDCRKKTDSQIACEIARKLKKARCP